MAKPPRQPFQESAYAKKLRDPRWQKKRLEILSRDEWMCQSCQNTEETLVVHHRLYIKGREPWDYDGDHLVTLCQECHELEHEHYPENAEQLVIFLKHRGFMAHDVEVLAGGFYCLRMRLPPEVIADILAWAMQDDETIKLIEARYFDYLHEKVAIEAKLAAKNG